MLFRSAWAYDKQVMLNAGGFFFELNTGAWYNSSINGSYKGTFIEIDTVDIPSYYSAEGLARRTQR